MCLYSVIFEGKQISQINSCLEDCHNHKGKKIIVMMLNLMRSYVIPIKRSL